MITGLAHESRNALARSQVAGLEMLGFSERTGPARNRLDLVGTHPGKPKITSKQLYEESATTPPLSCWSGEPRTVWTWCGRQAWNELGLSAPAGACRLRGDAEECAAVDLRCRLDAFRLEQVFRNILENALAACRDPVEIDGPLHCGRYWREKPALQVAVRDNGPGLNS